MEVMVVVAILAILAAIATPSYGRYIRKAEITKMAREFESALDVASYHARTSGREIKVCATTDTTVLRPKCITTAADFEAYFKTASKSNANVGWVVFWDINGNNVVDAKNTLAATPEETVFKRIPANVAKVRMIWTNSIPIISLQPRNTTGQSGTMCIYAPHGYNAQPHTGSSGANCEATTKLDNSVNEIKVNLTRLGKVTFID